MNERSWKSDLLRAGFSPLDVEFADLMQRLSHDTTGITKLTAAWLSWSRAQGDACLDLTQQSGKPLPGFGSLDVIDPEEALPEDIDTASEVGNGAKSDLEMGQGARVYGPSDVAPAPESNSDSDSDSDLDSDPDVWRGFGDWTAPPLSIWRETLLRAKSVVGLPGAVCPLILTEEHRLYLRRYWWYEQQIAAFVHQRLGADPGPMPLNSERLVAGLKRLFPDSPHGEVDWQQIAVCVALWNRFSVISGGPGTGKTRTVVQVLAMCIELALPTVPRIAMAAPTGKAAARLQETLRAMKGDLNVSDAVRSVIPDQVSTVHRLLQTVPGSPYFRHNKQRPLDVDVLVVDEASMVDLALMAKLLDAVPPHARVILLGDKDQLASVEAGAVLTDLCSTAAVNHFTSELAAHLQEWTGTQPPIASSGQYGLQDAVVQLQKNYRFGQDNDLYRLSSAVNEGDQDTAWQILKEAGPSAQHVGWRELPLATGLGSALHSRVATGYGPVFDAGSVEDALRHLDGFRILSPLRAGPYGIRAINHWVTGVLELDRRIQSGLDWYRGQPILVLANDHNLRLYNGDLGVVWPDENGVLTACFRNADGSIRRVGRARLPLYETAYAMTVHKSQGSEFGEVLLILPDRPSPLVTRELVYTGLTRARRKTEVWTKETIFRLAVATPTRRASGLKDALIKK